MRRSRKVLVFLLILGFVGFGYAQYAFASQIGVSVMHSELSEDGTDSRYDLQLQFDNPSWLYLTAGETEFVISADDEKIGHGTLSPFVLPALGKTVAYGTFEKSRHLAESEEVPTVKISGVTQYDIFITSIDVPFVFYPTEEQAREFIHQS